MSIKLILVSMLTLLSFTLNAREIRIGCTYQCDQDVKTSLAQAAKRLSQKIKIIDLSVLKKVDWSNLHGILIPGGEDIDPKYYLQNVEPDLQEYTRSLDHLVEYTNEGKKRDPFEFQLLQEYLSRSDLSSFPILGICRGMQMMAVSVGIPLYVDIKAELGIENRRDLYDRILISDTPNIMKELFPSLNVIGYKYHHQGIRVPYFQKHRARWQDWKVTAHSNNNMIAESFEHILRPALGIQFHPEADNNNVRKIIFDWFLKEAIRKSQTL